MESDMYFSHVKKNKFYRIETFPQRKAINVKVCYLSGMNNKLFM